MKKSEKIEIRISHEDKERLTELAQHEGQSVSELVRRLARRYVDMNTSGRGSVRQNWLKTAGLTFAGALFGVWLGMHVLYPHFAHTHDTPTPSYDVAIKLTGGPLGEQRLRTIMVVEQGQDATLFAGAMDDRYSVNANFSEDGQQLNFRICRTETQVCKDLFSETNNSLTVLDGYMPDRETVTLAIAPHARSHRANPAS